MGDETTIYEWAGGREAFARWLNRFYDLVEAEAPDIAALFGGTVSDEHREHVTDWWAEVMGGPADVHRAARRLRAHARAPPRPRDHARAAAARS